MVRPTVQGCARHKKLLQWKEEKNEYRKTVLNYTSSEMKVVKQDGQLFPRLRV
jgi:hypothetical protein